MRSLALVIFGFWATVLIVGLWPQKPKIAPQIQEVGVGSTIGTNWLEILLTDDYSWDFPDSIETAVTVTVYHAVPEQCKKDPSLLADGTRINPRRAGSYRFCALSRDLLERWDGPYAYGDTIALEGAGWLSGQWIVRDTMDDRFTNRVDLLVDVRVRNVRFDVATIRKAL